MDLDATEIRFAQQLASNEKKQRDKSLKKLRKYLQAKSASKKKGFTDEDFMKIWKGLHYCMWMQDKPLIQEELSTKISQLVHDLATYDAKLLFIKVFIQTEAREWDAIDKWRLDKFLMMFRNVLTQSFNILKSQNWKVKVMERLMTVFTDTILKTGEENIPFGLRGHFMDIYLDEIHNTGGSKINTKQFIHLIEPFIQFLLHVKSPELSSRVVTAIFDPIIERTTRLNLKPDNKTSDTSKNDVLLPDLQIDSKLIADHLFEIGMSETIPQKKRGIVYSLVKRLHNACEGVVPPKPELSKKRAIPRQMIGEAVASLIELEQDKVERFKEGKKKKKKVITDGDEDSGIEHLDVHMASLSEEPKVIIGKKRKLTDTDENQEPFTKMKRKKTVEKDAEMGKVEQADEKKSKNNGKKKGKGKKAFEIKSREEVLKTVSSNGVSTVKIPAEEDNEITIDQKADESKNSEKQKGKGKKSSENKVKEEVSKPVEKSDVTSVIQIKPSEDLEEGETEIFVPSKKYKGKINMSKFANFESKKTPVAFVKRALSKTNKSIVGTPAYVKKKTGTPAANSATPGSAKRVSFNVKRNRSQSFKDSLKSPIVPFNPLKTPEQSILKTPKGDSSVKRSIKQSTGKASAESLPSSEKLKTLKKTPKRTPKSTSTQKTGLMKTPIMSLNAKLKRKVAADFFSL